MLLIKNGKISSKKIIFSLPEEMYFDFDYSTYARDRLMFISPDGVLELNVHILEHKKDYSVEMLLNHKSFISFSELLTINRGGLIGKGIFYRNRTWDHEYYEEQLNIGDGYIASIRITCKVNPTTRDHIRMAILTDPIKSFLEKISANERKK